MEERSNVQDMMLEKNKDHDSNKSKKNRNGRSHLRRTPSLIRGINKLKSRSSQEEGNQQQQQQQQQQEEELCPDDRQPDDDIRLAVSKLRNYAKCFGVKERELLEAIRESSDGGGAAADDRTSGVGEADSSPEFLNSIEVRLRKQKKQRQEEDDFFSEEFMKTHSIKEY
jgi:hypothetical protein